MYARYIEESGKHKKTVKIGKKVVSKLEGTVGKDGIEHAKRPRLAHEGEAANSDQDV